MFLLRRCYGSAGLDGGGDLRGFDESLRAEAAEELAVGWGCAGEGVRDAVALDELTVVVDHAVPANGRDTKVHSCIY